MTFVPLLDYLDDLILLPLGIYVALKLIPEPVLTACRRQAAQQPPTNRPASRLAATLIVSLWILGLLWLFTLAYNFFAP